MTDTRPIKCLTIAGSDSGGGAGLQADLKVFHSLGCYGSSIITCVTAQNTQKVKSIFPIPSSFVGEQIDAVLEDIGTDCIKIGALLNSEIVHIVAEKIRYYKSKFNFKLIIDPVMISKSGSYLMNPSAVNDFINQLIPLADVLTPNLPEALVLQEMFFFPKPNYQTDNLNNPILTRQDMISTAKKLVTLGAKSIVLKGGHLENNEMSDDLLVYKSGNKIHEHWLHASRILTKNTHGTGCTFSAAICAFLGKNHNLIEAVTLAKNFVTTCLEKGKFQQLGEGIGPVQF